RRRASPQPSPGVRRTGRGGNIEHSTSNIERPKNPYANDVVPQSLEERTDAGSLSVRRLHAKTDLSSRDPSLDYLRRARGGCAQGDSAVGQWRAGVGRKEIGRAHV